MSTIKPSETFRPGAHYAGTGVRGTELGRVQVHELADMDTRDAWVGKHDHDMSAWRVGELDARTASTIDDRYDALPVVCHF